MRNWSEIYPQLCIFFSEIMEKYTKWEFRLEVVYTVYFTGSNITISHPLWGTAWWCFKFMIEF
jgi:hypothetical protein